MNARLFLIVGLRFVLLSLVGGTCWGGQDTAVLQNSSPAAQESFRAIEPTTQPIKIIGIIGGVSWASSIEYYRLMNEMVRDTMGGVHSAQILMFSIEFGEFSKEERLADKGDWTLITKTMIDAAQRLKRGAPIL